MPNAARFNVRSLCLNKFMCFAQCFSSRKPGVCRITYLRWAWPIRNVALHLRVSMQAKACPYWNRLKQFLIHEPSIKTRRTLSSRYLFHSTLIPVAFGIFRRNQTAPVTWRINTKSDSAFYQITLVLACIYICVMHKRYYLIAQYFVVNLNSNIRWRKLIHGLVDLLFVLISEDQTEICQLTSVRCVWFIC